MKQLVNILFIATAIIFSSCEGPMGPAGYDGLDGLDGLDGKDGDSFIGTSIEIKGDFTGDNGYSLYYAFEDDNVTVYADDVVLVYILWEQAETNDGGLTDVWRLLPQTVILPEGILQYNFDYTTADVQVFLEGTLDLGTLLESEWKDQILKIAVLPSEFVKKEGVDIQDFSAIMQSSDIKLKNIESSDIINSPILMDKY